MSVIIAMKDTKNKVVYMGSDSQISRGSLKVIYHNENDSKIWKPKTVDDCIIGISGSVRISCLIKAKEEYLFEGANEKGITFEFLSNFIEKLIVELKEIDLANADSDGDLDIGIGMIICYKDKIFHITQGASLLEIDDVLAIGIGDEAALGSYCSTEVFDTEDRVKLAVDAAIKNYIYVDYPITIMDTKNRNTRVYTKEDVQKIYDGEKEKVRKISEVPEARMLIEAIKLAKKTQKISISAMQRKFNIGYGVASKIAEIIRALEIIN